MGMALVLLSSETVVRFHLYLRLNTGRLVGDMRRCGRLVGKCGLRDTSAKHRCSDVSR